MGKARSPLTPQRQFNLTSLSHQNHHHQHNEPTKSPRSHRRWDRRDGIVRAAIMLAYVDMPIHHFTSSTITYDVLVRGGVTVTSSFVPVHAPANAEEATVSPPAAKCSRGVRIIPDTYFDAGSSGPVSDYRLFLVKARPSF